MDQENCKSFDSYILEWINQFKNWDNEADLFGWLVYKGFSEIGAKNFIAKNKRFITFKGNR